MNMADKDRGLNALRINRIRCVLAAAVCAAICAMVFMAFVYHMLAAPNELIKEVGWQTFHLFTILSNMIVGVVCAMCIPFCVDGIRYHNYHLPRWFVNLLYMAVCGVAVTFMIAITVLSPAVGFYRVMIYRHNIIMHTISPVLSIMLFIFINSDHRLKFRSSLIAVIPLMTYAVLYAVMVFAVGEEAGGWRDHYQIYRVADRVPIPVLLIIVFLIGLVISNLLRFAHNAVHKRRKASLERYYQQADAFAYDDIASAIKALADIDRQRDMGGELTVPRRIMAMMEKKYKSGLSMWEMCGIYIGEYYNDDGRA